MHFRYYLLFNQIKSDFNANCLKKHHTHYVSNTEIHPGSHLKEGGILVHYDVTCSQSKISGARQFIIGVFGEDSLDGMHINYTIKINKSPFQTLIPINFQSWHSIIHCKEKKLSGGGGLLMKL